MTRDEIVRWTNGIENSNNDTKFHKQSTIRYITTWPAPSSRSRHGFFLGYA